MLFLSYRRFPLFFRDIRSIELIDEERHEQQDDAEKEECYLESYGSAQIIRREHDDEDDKACRDAVGDRSVFFPLIFADMEEISSFQEIDGDTEEDSDEESEYVQGDIIIVFVDDVREIDGRKPEDDREDHGDESPFLFEEYRYDMSYDGAEERDDDDGDGTFRCSLEDIHADLQHLLPYGSRHRPQGADRHEQPYISFRYLPYARNRSPERLQERFRLELLIVFQDHGQDARKHQYRHDDLESAGSPVREDGESHVASQEDAGEDGDVDDTVDLRFSVS